MSRSLLLLLLLTSLTACNQSSTPTSHHAKPSLRTVKITTVTSSNQDIEVTEEALGRVVDPDATTIAAEIPGRITKIAVDVGDRVRKGDLLAQIDARDTSDAVEAAQADLARATTRIPVQKRLVTRYAKLAHDKFVSPTMLEQAESELIALKKSAKAARARLTQARTNLHRARIVAPMNGRIQRRLVAAGDYIAVGKPMFQLVTDGKLLVSIPIPETRITRIHPGQPVRLHLAGGKRSYPATIGEITPMIGAASNSVAARVHLDQPGGWRPGASVVAEMVLALHRQAVVVPEASVVLRPAGEVVYRIAKGVAHAITVQTGVHRSGMVEIISGIKAGATLAATGAGFLSDGAAVEVKR